MELTVYAVPALFALFAKAFIFVYARHSQVRNLETRLYLLFLFALSVQNIAELTFFVRIHGERLATPPGGMAYFGASIVALAAALHLAAALALDSGRNMARHYLMMIYGPAIVLEGLLWFSPWLVAGFEPLQYTYTRIAGPAYFLFEIYAITYVGAVITLLVVGMRSAETGARRTKNQLALVGLLPAAMIVIAAVVFLHLGIHWFNSTVTIPIAITFFLLVTAYATHQHRLFDIEFYIPWSTVRRRKTAFYGRIRAMIAEIADLHSIDNAVQRLAETLHCPVALIGGQRPAVALAGATNFRVDVPEVVLRKLDHVVVRNEIAAAMPEMHAVLKRHGIAAVVPFHPHSEFASGWLLLGDSFSQQVYTRLDFKMVEELFDKMADLFLDKLVTMRAQLADAFRQIRTLELRQVEMQGQLSTLRTDNAELIKLNGWLRQQQPVDTLALSSASQAAASAVTLTLLGRDKALLKVLRRKHPQLAQYASTTSSGFRRQPRPDVLIAHLGADSQAEANALARVMSASNNKMAVLLYGTGAERFVEENKRSLLGRLVEILSPDTTETVWLRRIEALSELAKALHAVPDVDQPLLGQSGAFCAQMQQAQRLGGLIDALLIKTTDFEAAAALAAHIHDTGRNRGGFRVLRETDLPAANDEAATEASIGALVASVRDGTLMLPDIGSLTQTFSVRLLQELHDAGDVRVIAACSASSTRGGDQLLAPFRPFVLEMPGMRERKQDVPLLVHYFTLQFNLQTGGHRYVTQAELDELMASQYPETMLSLKRSVFDLLSREGEGTIPTVANSVELLEAGGDKTLDHHVAEFEARIIDETLKRCGGNKSKAARLLGLRPNTLHYKLERYGLNAGDK